MKTNKFKIIIFIFFNILVLEIFSFFLWINVFKDLNHAGVVNVKKFINDPTFNNTYRLKSHPYSLYWNNNEYAPFGKKIYSSLGHRSEEIQNDHVIKILALGGSTTNSYPYVEDNNKIWTKLLENKIEEYLEKKTIVINAGLPSATTQELMIHFLQIGKYLEPDIVLIHTGGNDVGALIYPDYKTDYSHIRKSSNNTARKFEKTILKYSHFMRLFYSYWANSGIYEDYPFSSTELIEDDVIRRVKNNPSDGFKNNLSVIIREGINLNSKIFLIGYLQDLEENRNIIDKSKNNFMSKAFTIGVNKHLKIMKKLALDYEQFYMEFNPHDFQYFFLDDTHLNEDGHLLKSELIFQHILRENLI